MDKGIDPTNTKYFNFRFRVKAVESQRELDALHVIKRAADGGYKVRKTKVKQTSKGDIEHERTETTLAPVWHAAAWYLERKNKGEWGRDKVIEDRTAEEFAREIKDATDALFNGIPLNQPLEADNL
jgi:hypothetical protein